MVLVSALRAALTLFWHHSQNTKLIIVIIINNNLYIINNKWTCKQKHSKFSSSCRTSLHFNLWEKNSWQNATEQYVNTYLLSFKKVCRVTLGCQYKFMAPRPKTVRMSKFQAKYNEERSDRLIKQQQTNRHPDRQRADPRWNRLGDKNWDEHSDAFKSLFVGWIRKAPPCGRRMPLSV